MDQQAIRYTKAGIPLGKKRTLTTDEFNSLVKRFLSDCKSLKDGDEVSAIAVGKKYNVAISVVKKIIIESFTKGLPRIKLVDTEKIPLIRPESPYINHKMSIIIGKSIIDRINNELPHELRFKENDMFTVGVNKRSIYLTLIE